MATDLHAVIPPNAAGIGDINKYDFRTESTAVFKARRGIDAEIVTQISSMKTNPPGCSSFVSNRSKYLIPSQCLAGVEPLVSISKTFLLPQACRAAGENVG